MPPGRRLAAERDRRHQARAITRPRSTCLLRVYGQESRPDSKRSPFKPAAAPRRRNGSPAHSSFAASWSLALEPLRLPSASLAAEVQRIRSHHHRRQHPCRDPRHPLVEATSTPAPRTLQRPTGPARAYRHHRSHDHDDHDDHWLALRVHRTLRCVLIVLPNPHRSALPRSNHRTLQLADQIFPTVDRLLHHAQRLSDQRRERAPVLGPGRRRRHTVGHPMTRAPMPPPVSSTNAPPGLQRQRQDHLCPEPWG